MQRAHTVQYNSKDLYGSLSADPPTYKSFTDLSVRDYPAECRNSGLDFPDDYHGYVHAGDHHLRPRMPQRCWNVAEGDRSRDGNLRDAYSHLAASTTMYTPLSNVRSLDQLRTAAQ